MRLTVVAAVFLLVTSAAVILVRRNDSAIQNSRLQERTTVGSTAAAAARSATQTPRLAAPDERQGIDDGVAEAARQFAIQFVTPELKYPESALFPESSIRLERYALMNFSTGNRIEHWYVDGAVDSRNDYGVQVGSRWRIMIGRVDDKFFPVVVTLEGLPVYQMRGHVAMLQDARLAEAQQKAALAEANKAEELAENRAAWQASAAAKPAEQKAREALKLALALLDAGRIEPAHRRLREIIEKFPDTAAAAEAEQMLNP